MMTNSLRPLLHLPLSLAPGLAHALAIAALAGVIALPVSRLQQTIHGLAHGAWSQAPAHAPPWPFRLAHRVQAAPPGPDHG